MIRSRLSTVLACLGLVIFASVFLIPAVAFADAPGSLDPTFGTGGIALTSFGPGLDKAVALAVQPDGKYLLAGTHTSSDPSAFRVYWTLARFNTDGSLDNTFGSGGKVTADPSQTDAETVADILYLPADGSIILASVTQQTLSRYLADGSRDMSFGNAGVVQMGGASGATETRLSARTGGGFFVGRTVPSVYGDTNLQVRCYHADGTLDAAFGSAGIATLDIASGSNDQLLCLAATADGGILVGGAVQGDGVTARLTSSGALDASFGSGGLVVFSNSGGAVTHLWPQGSGGWLVASGFTSFTLHRLSAAGSVDHSYGGSGSVTVTPQATATQIAMQPDGSILLTGTKNDGFPSYNDIWVRRFAADGSPDLGFGTDGQVVTDLGGADDCAAAAVGPDGKLVVAGYAYPSGASSASTLGGRRSLTTMTLGMGLIRYDCGPSAVRPGPKTFAPKAVTVKHGKRAAFSYRVTASTAKVTVKIKIFKGKRVKKTLSAGSVTAGASHTYRWKCSLAKGKYTWKVYATDADNRTQVSIGTSRLTVK